MKRRTVDSESILSATIDLIRSGGWDAVSARAIAKSLRCSTMPIYSTAGSMESLRMSAAQRVQDLLTAEQHRPRTGNESLDLAVGYVAFAREQPGLFRFLMRIARENVDSDVLGVAAVQSLLGSMSGDANREEFLFHSWVFTHGLADLIASKAITLSDSEIIRHLTFAGGAFLREHQRS